MSFRPRHSEFESFNQLVRESRLNNHPELSPREHHIGSLATELRTCEDPIRRAKIAADMFTIATHATVAAEERREQLAFAEDLAKQGVTAPPDRSPMRKLVDDLIAASIERAKLKLPPPSALRGVSGKRLPEGPISEMAESYLLFSLVESREMCDQANERTK